MCGIAGLIDKDIARVPSTLNAMGLSIAHRGPDGSGEYIDGSVGIAHRRLAINDLSEAATQPMLTEDGRFAISYNGEIYNFNEVKAELEAKGHQFRSRSDTEVVLKSYVEWGRESIKKFNGMFAFAIYDKKERQIFLARDRYGIKPLYYFKSDNCFVFASEIKALLVHRRIDPEIDREGLLEYFTFQNFFSSRTIIKNVNILPAGCMMSVNADSPGEAEPRQYWDFSFQEPSKFGSEDDYLEELDSIFTRAVNRHLLSDVEIGGYLSGGMDSGAITRIAANSIPNLKTFTCGFDMTSATGIEIGFDERAAAERMSYLFGTEQYEIVLKSGDMERVIPRLTRALEEPRVGQSYPNYYIAGLASKFVKVALSGVGGDEMFGGYPWRYYRTVSSNSFDDYIDNYYKSWQRLIPNEAIARVFKPIWSEVKHVWTRDIFRSVFHAHADRLTRPEDYINHSLYFEAKTFLHGLLVVEDKLSMAHGLEVRVPFLDNELVDFAMRLPTRFKLRDLDHVIQMNENEPAMKTAKYFQKTNDGKLLLRKLMRRHVPAEIVDRDKQGFSGPDASWFKGESIEYVQRRLLTKDAKIYDYFDFDAVADLINDHLSGRVNRRLLIWSLLNFEEICCAISDGTFVDNTH